MAILSLFKRLVKGAPLTNAEGDSNWVKLEQFMNSKTLTSSENLNDMTAPGGYHQPYTGDALPSLNYPVQQAGMLVVRSGQDGGTTTVQLYQMYFAYSPADPWIYYRSWYSDQWGQWFKLARADQAMQHVYLTAPSNANNLTADNTYYTWVYSTPIIGSGGANWPPVANATVGAGYMNVWRLANGLAVQECVFLVNGQKPRRFSRLGFGTSWEPWKIIGPLSSTAYLPVADCGDVYVDNFGWCRWSTATSSYTGMTVATGILKMGEGTTFYGSFTGDYTAGVSTVFQDNLGSTYLTAVPGPSGGTAGFIARNWKSPNAQFVLLGIDQASGIGQLLFSKHGTAGTPIYFTFNSATGECGRIIDDGRWQFGRFQQPNVQTKLHVYYTGGGTEYGMVLRPQLFVDTTAIQFQLNAGQVAGYITANTNLSVTYATTSDYRLKNVVAELDPEESLEIVRQYRPISFRMKMSPADSVPQEGFLAHELQAHTPQAVMGEKDGMKKDQQGNDVPDYQGVDAAKTIPRLVSTIHALINRVEAMQEEIRILKGGQ